MKLLHGLTASVTTAVLLSMLPARGYTQDPTRDPAAPRPFVVRVVDEATGRGVPLVKLRLLSQQAWHTDSNGIAAIVEPWLLGQEVFLIVTSDGYALEDDAGVWDEPGTFLTVLPGAEATLRMRRINIAERLYRMTGAGIYAHSVAAGLPVPLRQPLLNGKVTGQDTGVAIAYKGLIYWFWGDTFGLADANFNVSGATAPLPEAGGTNPDAGIDLTYFLNDAGFSKALIPMKEPLVWVESLMLITDPTGAERLVATWARVGEDLAPVERGVAVFDDTAREFRTIAQMPADRKHHSSHPVRVVEGGRAWWYLYPHRRVQDDWHAVQDPAAYESFTCTAPGLAPSCTWRPGAPFLESPAEEQRAIAEGRLHPDAAHFALVDVETGRSMTSGTGSIAWNEFRGRWVMIAGGFGDVFYSEADAPEGPWRCARHIVRHERYDFYNVAQRPLLDRDGGRVIYFEGTYTTGFVQGAVPTPLYDYNQIMYRLTLDDPRLRLPSGC